MSLPLTDRALADARYPELFDGTVTTFNIASGQVQGELDVYFLNGGAGGLSTTGQVVATTGFQVLGGTSSFDGNLASTDGSGNFSAVSFLGAGDNLTIGGYDLGVVLSGAINAPNGNSGVLLMDNGDASNVVTTSANTGLETFLAGLLSGGITVNEASNAGFASVADFANTADSANFANTAAIGEQDPLGNNLYGTDNSVSGIAAFQSNGSFAQATIANVQSLLNDTGWTANADAGDKTVVIGSTASLTTIATALNLVSAGAGTALLNIAQKVKALEAALAAGNFPNA